MEFGTSRLQPNSMLVVTGNVSGPAGSGSVHIEGLMHGLQNLWVSTHAEVVIGTPDGYTLIPGGHMGLGKLLSETIDVVEVPVGLVLVLLVKLRIVESFVVKLRGRRSCRCRSGRRSVLNDIRR